MARRERDAAVQVLQKRFITTAHILFGRGLDELTDQEIYRTITATVKELISEDWIRTNRLYQEEHVKQVYYFSMEFLLGRLLNTNLINLGVKETLVEALKGLNLSLAQFYDEEPDAGTCLGMAYTMRSAREDDDLHRVPRPLR